MSEKAPSLSPDEASVKSKELYDGHRFVVHTVGMYEHAAEEFLDHLDSKIAQSEALAAASQDDFEDPEFANKFRQEHDVGNALDLAKRDDGTIPDGTTIDDAREIADAYQQGVHKHVIENATRLYDAKTEYKTNLRHAKAFAKDNAEALHEAAVAEAVAAGARLNLLDTPQASSQAEEEQDVTS